MAGVGLRSEQQFDKDSSERAKRNLGKDLGDMEVDAGADRPAKDKPVETTLQIAKKTKKDEIADGGSADEEGTVEFLLVKGLLKKTSENNSHSAVFVVHFANYMRWLDFYSCL